MRRGLWVASLAAAAMVLAAGIPACGGGEEARTTQRPEASVVSDGADAAQWCERMLEGKARLRTPHAELFAASPNGDATPSSGLLSLDGSPEAVQALRDYLETLEQGAPTEVAAAIQASVAQLDELSTELAANPGEPGRSAISGMGVVGALLVLDEHARENCGETF